MKHLLLVFTKALAVLALAIVGLANIARADPILYNTGLANPYASDPHWTLFSVPSGPSIALVTDDTKWPLGTGPWVKPNNSTSKWISPYADGHTAAVGDYVYRLPVDLTGLNLTTVVIQGRFASDNPGYIYVNSTNTGYTGESNEDLSEPQMYGKWMPFTLTYANSQWINGVNDIYFKVINWSGTSGNPTGLRVEFIPEPLSMAFLASAFLGVVGVRLRSRRKEANRK